MNQPQPPGVSLERNALRTAALSGIVALALSWLEPGSVSMACRLALFSCMAPAIGCLILVLIHRTTGGQWASGLAPYLRAGAALLPWIWLLALPILCIPSPHRPAPPRPGHPWFSYDGMPMVAARACLFGVVFFGLSWAVSDGIGRDEEPGKNNRPWIGPVGLIIVFFMLTLLADDWLESLETGWHSTAFPVVWMAGQTVSGLSLSLLGGLWTGARPASSGAARRPLGLDWGNLLLTTLLFWCYVAFAQFLIIWAGDLPEEISWYLRREAGGWGYVVPAGAIFGFAIPFFLLLSRRVKVSVAGLAWTAGLLLASQATYMVWVIVPAAAPVSLRAAILDVSFLVAAAGIFVNRYACTARRFREKAA